MRFSPPSREPAIKRLRSPSVATRPGGRPSAVDAYNVIRLVGDVTRIAARLGAPTFHLVGHDWGGGVAWVTRSVVPQARHQLDRALDAGS